MNSKIYAIVIVLAILIVGALSAYSANKIPAKTPSQTTTTPPKPPANVTLANSFSSIEELKNFIKESMELSSMPFSIAKVDRFYRAPIAPPVPLTATGIPATFEVAKAAAEYSVTNVQVAGVDEADIVKTDGKYIYVVSGENVTIVKAYPPDNAKLVSTINVKGFIGGIFVRENRLIIISSPPQYHILFGTRSETPILPTEKKAIIAPRVMNTTILIYDISNIETPTLLKEINVTGSYVTSRLIGKYCYIIINYPAMLIEDTIPLPVINGEEILPIEVKYFERDYSYTFTIILSIDIETGNYSKEVFLTGNSNYIYMSHENLYILSRKFVNTRKVLEKVLNIILEKAPSYVKEKVESIKQMEISEPEKYKHIAEELEIYFNNLTSVERDKILKAISKELETVWREETVIYRFSLDGFNISAEAKGSVPGYVLDQFSMDEYNGYFRVATTTRSFSISGVPKTLNNVYVLNMNLEIVGKLEGLALGESIYAARYMGDKMFLVTFRRVDPLFAIDLSDPENPKVLGKLKLPGYSEYLHPYGNHYLIGVGRDVDEKTGAVKGIKVSLFDISDVENPVETSTIIIGEGWNVWTPILHDHKAFMINLNKSYMAIPIQGEKSGAYIIDIVGDKLILRGTIPHRNVLRTLYIDDYIYTISSDLIKIVDENLTPVGEILLTK